MDEIIREIFEKEFKVDSREFYWDKDCYKDRGCGPIDNADEAHSLTMKLQGFISGCKTFKTTEEMLLLKKERDIYKGIIEGIQNKFKELEITKNQSSEI